jgi:hypothetical protein
MSVLQGSSVARVAPVPRLSWWVSGYSADGVEVAFRTAHTPRAAYVHRDELLSYPDIASVVVEAVS